MESATYPNGLAAREPFTATKSWWLTRLLRRVPGRLWRGGIFAIGLLALIGWLAPGHQAGSRVAPEAGKVMGVQANMPFQVLIPAYLPAEFDRQAVDIKVNDLGPGGEPMVQLAYRTRTGVTLYVREWIPVNPDIEILSASRPIETKWGKGWLLVQGTSLGALWVDVGPMRASIYSQDFDVLTREQLLAMAESLGPASDRQVFTFVVDQPVVRELPPAQSFEVEKNAAGVQELILVVTPGGYAPLRFAVRKGQPVKLTFQQLGEVGCGNELIFPADPANPVTLKLAHGDDKQVLEFTPRQAGEFQFYCSQHMYVGVMTVRE
jgi:hypothetical protein